MSPLRNLTASGYEPFPDEGDETVHDAQVVPAPNVHPQLADEVVARIDAAPWAADEDAAFSIGMQILDAKTAEEVGTELESRSVRNMRLVGEPLTLTHFVFAPSAFADSPEKCPIVAYVDATRHDGEVVQFPIGNWGPTMQLLRWYEFGLLRNTVETAVKVKIIEIQSRIQGHAPALRFVML